MPKRRIKVKVDNRHIHILLNRRAVNTEGRLSPDEYNRPSVSFKRSYFAASSPRYVSLYCGGIAKQILRCDKR